MKRSRNLQFESLESLTFMSGFGLPPMANPAVAAAYARRVAARPAAPQPASAAQQTFDARFQGSYVVQQDDTGRGSMAIEGVGTVRGIGPMRIQAAYNTSVSNPGDHMIVNLTNARGTITLRIEEAPNGMQPPPESARRGANSFFRIVSGTGNFASTTGIGWAGLSLVPQMRTMGTTGQVSLRLDGI